MPVGDFDTWRVQLTMDRSCIIARNAMAAPFRWVRMSNGPLFEVQLVKFCRATGGIALRATHWLTRGRAALAGRLCAAAGQTVRVAVRRVPSAHARVETSGTSKQSNRCIYQDVCPWNRKFAVELAADLPFRLRPCSDGKDAVTLATGIFALDQEQLSRRSGSHR